MRLQRPTNSVECRVGNEFILINVKYIYKINRALVQLGSMLALENEISIFKHLMDITQQKGLSTLMHCMLDFTNLGYSCLTPIDDSSRYDIVIDLNGKFIRIQCKTASWATRHQKSSTSAFAINTYRQTTNTKKTTRYKYSADEIDYFYTWFNGQGYLVSVNEATGITFTWRYEYPSTNQKEGIHIAENYKIEEVISKIV